MKETANRYTIALLSVIAVLALAAFSAPASAECDCVTIDNGTINGSIYYKSYAAWEGTAADGGYTASHTFTGVPAGVKTARVHAGVWMLDPGSVNITVNGNASGPQQASDCSCNSITSNDRMHDYCTGYGVHFITYNATADIPSGGGNIPVTVASTNAGDGRIYTIALLVVYEDNSTASMTYWINEGAWLTWEDPAVTNFNGSYPDGVTDVTYWTLGIPYGITANPSLNNESLGAPDYGETGYYDLERWDNINTTFLNASYNQMVYPGSGGDWERLDVAVLRLWRSPSDLPDLIVTDVDFPDVMRPNTNYTVNATIKNQGNEAANASNVTLYANTADNGTRSIQQLNASNSTTVNFTVNLSEGCYTFNVVADVDNDVSETDENNNATSEKYQVGYVVVVKSDSDFDDLVNESTNGTLGTGNVSETGGTYYLQNFTIKNCAGNGITIEDTTKKFVIKNCTIHDCSGSTAGVYFHNLSNGTIKDSTVEDNTGKGIRIQKSTYVNITNNTVQNNTAYGIDVYPETLSPENIDDSKFVNISYNMLEDNSYGIELIGVNCTVYNNTIRNNTVYGIYIYGNYTNVTHNTIQNNTDYGAKLYNSTGNYIYCNNFADNNASNSGHQACDNRNTNYWNSTELSKNYIGNHWKDWDDNSGYSCNYTIDCGSNVDKRPKGLYDFLIGGNEAFEDEVGVNPPVNNNSMPSEVFSSTSNIEVDDGSYQIAGSDSNGNYAAHRFNFSISEDPDEISEINVTWHGRGWHDLSPERTYDGAYLYICNDTGNYTELANNSGDDDWVYLTGGIAMSISDYISSSNNVTVLVVQKSVDTGRKNSYIATDYVGVAIIGP